MNQSLLYLLTAIGISICLGSNTAAEAITQKNDSKDKYIAEKPMINHAITPMEALDLVKECYAANFEKVPVALTEDSDESTEVYYYKLPFADYYLVYEGIQDENYYLIHLYEFVLDEPDTGIGHTVTYGWYTVDRITGEITEQMPY